MPHEFAGKYSTKHPPGMIADPAIAAAIEDVVADGRVGCAVAHDVAEDLEVGPAQVGKTLDLLEYRISKCQMGLFGYEPEKKIVKPAASVSDGLRQHLEGAMVDGAISCLACWGIAQELGMQKIAVAAACELLSIKVAPCQLGAF